MTTLINTSKTFILIGQILCLLLYNVVCLTSCGNHTSIDFTNYALTSLIFGLFVLTSSIVFAKTLGKPDRRTKAIIIIAIITSVNLYAFDYFNIMVEYDKWLDRGLPLKPFCNHQ